MASPVVRPSLGPVAESLRRRFGGLFHVRETFPAATAGLGSLVLPSHPGRFGVTMVNTGVNRIAISTRPLAAVLGIVLSPLGGFISMNENEDLILPSWEYYAIADVGGSTLYILELIYDVRLPEAGR